MGAGPPPTSSRPRTTLTPSTSERSHLTVGQMIHVDNVKVDRVMAQDPLMVLPPSAAQRARDKQARDQAERDRFNRLLRIAKTPGAVDTLVQMWVRCERCGKPVETMGWSGGRQDHAFTVRCHGEVETTRIEVGADVVALTGGVAFRRKIDG